MHVLVLVWVHVIPQLVLEFHLPWTQITHMKTCAVLLSEAENVSLPCHFPSHMWLSGAKRLTSVHFLAAVGAPRMVSLAPLPTRGVVRVTWTLPTHLCGLTNPQYTIQYARSTSTPTTHPSTPSSSPFDITGLEVGQEYFARVAVFRSGTFSSWELVKSYKGVRVLQPTNVLLYAVLNIYRI